MLLSLELFRSFLFHFIKLNTSFIEYLILYSGLFIPSYTSVFLLAAIKYPLNIFYSSSFLRSNSTSIPTLLSFLQIVKIISPQSFY